METAARARESLVEARPSSVDDDLSFRVRRQTKETAFPCHHRHRAASIYGLTRVGCHGSRTDMSRRGWDLQGARYPSWLGFN